MNGQIDIDNSTHKFLKEYNYNQGGNIKFTSIILLTHNKLEYTKLCIESIRKFTPKKQYEIIVIDNQSDDGTVEYLKSQSDIKTIYNDYNAGFPKGCNQGIKIAKGESILLLNNDTIVTPNWLNQLDKALYSNDKIGAVSAISNSCSNGQSIKVNYNSIEEMINFSSIINIKKVEEQYELRQHLVGYCYLVKKSVIDKVGLLDEIFTPGNFEDNDISYRIISSGYDLLLCKNVFIHHFGSISFNSTNKNYVDLLTKNRKVFSNKWGFDIEYNSTIRGDLINMMTHNKNQEINVLDIGCGTGATLHYIKNIYKNSNLYGIEKCKNCATIASKFSNIINEDIEKIDISYEDKFFDYIFLGDILEKLKDPWSVLDSLSRTLKNDGYILASIPNIMNFNTIKNILNGSFTYTNPFDFHFLDCKTLDLNNIRFFTASEINKMFNDSNLNIDGFYSVPQHISKEDEKFLNIICSFTNEELKIQYLSDKYLIKASKK